MFNILDNKGYIVQYNRHYDIWCNKIYMAEHKDFRATKRYKDIYTYI